ncbi:HTH-type transcriptional regulator GltC [Mycobacteroides salmoniphilum]|uniref:Probable hydrogen peroxide-inducible genes activator n=1 Tax=Mycobacteroides salmoniphilum TaxID=404941 RepID=A0A4R8S911_9MYCO|nr:HTH-type transcriptional regulator GltC [Mycobacteroides salmoniphilum]TEA00889.1 HTH-type transcriptional regulator GltC [Mycobacteroides salmoniphilum]
MRWSRRDDLIACVDVQQLRYFLAVADHLHFGRAAQRLHLSGPTLSRRIRDLEKELGQQLFRRGYHVVELTEFGNIFVDRARTAVQDFDGLKHLARGHDGATPPRYRVGATPVLPPNLLNTVLESFRECATEIDLPLALGTSGDILAALTKGNLDLAVVHLPTGDPDLASFALTMCDLVVLMRADDPLASRRELQLVEMTDRRIVLGGTGSHPYLFKQVRSIVTDAGITDVVELGSNNPTHMAAHVQRGGALALIAGGDSYPSARTYDTPEFTKVPLREPDLALTAGIAWPARQVAPESGIAQVIENLRTKYRDTPMRL